MKLMTVKIEKENLERDLKAYLEIAQAEFFKPGPMSRDIVEIVAEHIAILMDNPKGEP